MTSPAAEYSRVNLFSDPIYRYLRITKGGPGGVPGQASEQDLIDAAWLQRLRRIHQLQSAWWVFATAEHSRFQHSMGAQLVLFAGASAIDPLDPAYAELVNVGGELLQLGAPMHPGSMLWLGRLPDAAVVGVASCAGFGRSSSLDLLLPFVFAYGRADAKDLLRLGHGGLIESGAGRRFPPYS